MDSVNKETVVISSYEKEEETIIYPDRSLYSALPSEYKKKAVVQREELTLSNLLKKLFLDDRSVTPLSMGRFLTNYVVFPFLSGIMAGFGEMCACELFVHYGWRSSPIFFRDRF